MSVLKAITARRPCRNIPKESIKAPFSHPRLLGSGVGVEDTDVLVRDTAGIPAPPEPASATSPCWDSMLTPLAAAMGQKIWTWLINKVKKSSSSRSGPVLLRSCRSANRYAKQDSLRWKMVTSSPLKARTHSPASGIHAAIASLSLDKWSRRRWKLQRRIAWSQLSRVHSLKRQCNTKKKASLKVHTHTHSGANTS